MPRQIRTHFKGALYHVMLRGNFKAQIFYETEDYTFFLKLLSRASEKYNSRIHLFCLMTNHVHLVVEVGDVPLSKVMQCVASQYSNYMNHKMKREGHLFQGRYAAKLVLDTRYLLELCYYIHKNPYKAGMVSSLDDYSWSSHHAYCGRQTFTWLETSLVIESIREVADSDEFTYEAFLNAREIFFKEPHFCVLDEADTLDIVENFKEKIRIQEKPDLSGLGISELALIISQYMGLHVERLRGGTKEKPFVEARSLIGYFAHYHGRKKLVDIASYLNRNPDSFSRSLHAYLNKLNKDGNTEVLNRLEKHIVRIVGNDPTLCG